MHGIVSGLYQWCHVRKSTNFAQNSRQSGGVYYTPNLKEVEGAYWFGSVRAVQ